MGESGCPESRKGCWLTFQRLTQPNGGRVSGGNSLGARMPRGVVEATLGERVQARALVATAPDSAATQPVPGDACGRDGECLLFLLTARGSPEVACPETGSLRRKSASVGVRAPVDASITGPKAHENLSPWHPGDSRKRVSCGFV